MKKFVLLLCLLAVPGSALARSPIRYERFTLFSQPFKGRTGCDHVVLMEVDYFERTAKLENSVLGGCEIHIVPMPRTYKLELSEKSGCGSWVTQGQAAESGDRFFKLSIQDNRRRVCKDLRATLEVTESGRNEGEVRRLYTEH